MTKIKKCDECSGPVGSQPHYIKFRMARLGETEKGKETVCSDCYEEWKLHEQNCENPPGECFSIIRESNNTLTILDARTERYNLIRRRKTTDNYYDL